MCDGKKTFFVFLVVHCFAERPIGRKKRRRKMRLVCCFHKKRFSVRNSSRKTPDLKFKRHRRNPKTKISHRPQIHTKGQSQQSRKTRETTSSWLQSLSASRTPRAPAHLDPKGSTMMTRQQTKQKTCEVLPCFSTKRRTHLALDLLVLSVIEHSVRGGASSPRHFHVLERALHFSLFF